VETRRFSTRCTRIDEEPVTGGRGRLVKADAVLSWALKNAKNPGPSAVAGVGA